MYANYGMDMPKRYVDLSEDEMEYDGGFFGINFAVSIAATIVGAVATVAGDAGLIDKKLADTISYGCTVISVICSIGTIGAVANANAAIKLGKTVVESGTKTINTVETVRNGIASLTLDAGIYTANGAYALAN